MSYLRLQIDALIKESPDGTPILSSLNTDTGRVEGGISIPRELATELTNIRNAIRRLMEFSSPINKGLTNEERPYAKFHICHHDTGDQSCEPEQEI